MLHSIALDYSCNTAAHGHLHVYVITVILYIPQLYYYQHKPSLFEPIPVLGCALGHYFYNAAW